MPTTFPVLQAEIAFNRNPQDFGFMVLPGTAGNYASTPDSAALSITGDLDIRAKVAPDNWTASSNPTFVAKYGASGQRSFLFRTLSTGRLRLDWSTDGTATLSAQSTVSPELTNGAVKWVRVTIDVDNGASGRTVTFYTSDDGSTWTIVGSAVTTSGVTSIFDSTAPLEVGSNTIGTGNPFAGKVYQAEVRNGIGGTVVASPDFTTNDAPAFTDTQNNVWTLHGTANPWTDVSPYLIPTASTKRGRQRELDQFQPGSFSVVLDNSDRRFDPTNTSSPYYPNVIPNRRIRLRSSYGGKFGSSLYFDGSNDHVDMGNVFNRTGTAAFTFEAWINLDTTVGAERTIVSNDDGTNGYSFRVLATGVISLYRRAAGVVQVRSANTALSASTWHHVAAVYDGTNISLYVNGVLDNTPASGGGSIAAQTSTFQVGRRQSANHFKGKIDDLRGWTTARTQSQLQANKDTEADGTETGLAGYWKFNEGEGITAKDSSPSGFTGTLTNGPVWTDAIYPVIDGYIDSWPPTWRVETAQVVVSATDGMKLLAKADLPPNPYAEEVLADNPNVFWRLNEANSNDAATDSSGHGRNGRYAGNPAMNQSDPITDAQDGAITLLGGYDGVGGQSGFSGTGAFSVEFWFKTVETVGYDIIRQAQRPAVGGNREISAGMSGGFKPRFATSDGSGGTVAAVGTTEINNGAWHHIVGVRESGGTLRVYLNGVQEGTATGTSADIASNPFTVGQNTTIVTTYSVDEVAFYPSALSATRVADHYEARNAWLNDRTGDRVTRVLDTVDWPSADRSIDTGVSSLQAEGNLGSKALEYLLKVAESEFGSLYLQKNGKLKFRERHAIDKAPYTTVQATLADDGTGHMYANPKIEYDEMEIRNDVSIQRDGGNPQRVEDASSISTYFRSSYSRSGLRNVNDDELRDAADYILDRYKDPFLQITSITLEPHAEDTDGTMWTQVLSRELEDRVRVKATPPGGGPAIDRELHIQGISHEIGPGPRWITTWDLSQAQTAQTFWVLGTSALGTDTTLSF